MALVPHHPLSESMTGPGWRYWHLAATLARHLDARLLAPPGSAPVAAGGAPVEEVSPDRLGARLADHDALITQGTWLSPLRDGAGLAQTRLLLDFYDPLPVELPHHYAAGRDVLPPDGERRYARARRRLAFLIQRADAFLVANPRQRDLLLGLALAHGGVEAGELVRDPHLERRFLRVPGGTEELPGRPAPDEGARPLAWGGGTWSWFDTDLALLAVTELHQGDPRYHLVLPGIRPPGPEGRLARASGMLGRARRAGLVGGAVRPLEHWMPRPEFLRALARCRVGLSLAHAGLESHFAHRTRVLDYLSAGLPCVLTRGDLLAEEGEAEGWARVVPPGDLDAVLAAVRQLAEPGPDRERALEAVAVGRRRRLWSRQVQDLVAYLENPPPPRTRAPWAWSAMLHQLRRLPGL